MRTIVRRSLAAAAAVAVLLPVGAPSAYAAATVTVRSASLVVPCGAGTTTGTTTADWYVPDGVTPRAVVWLQHGFSRSRGNVSDLARRISLGTDAIVVAASAGPCGGINNLGYHQGIARLFGGQQARLQASFAAAFPGRTLPEAYVLAGHSAGGNAATSAAGFSTLVEGDRPNLRGVMLFDPVQNGTSMSTGLARIPGVPVATVSAPNSACNASSSGTVALKAARPGQFIGVRLANGSHTDAEGPNSSFLANLTCGFPRTANVEALRQLSVTWIDGMLAGTFGVGPSYPLQGTTIAVAGASAAGL